MSESERAKMEFMSPGKWEELKVEMRKECSSLGQSLVLRVHETGNEFIVERLKDSWAAKRLRLEYDRIVPRIKWTCCDPHENRGEISFGIVNDSVFYLVNGGIRPLSEIVQVLSSCITGSI
jgi:hypothetical protein